MVWITTRFTWEARARSVNQGNQRLWWNSFWSGFVDTLGFGTSTPSEMVNFHFSRTPDFDVTLSHVTDFPNDRWALCFRFFSQISKKVQKNRSKSGDRMMLAPMANRFKERSLLEQLQNHASNYQGAPGLSTPSDPPRKKWLFSEAAAAAEEQDLQGVGLPVST